MNKLLLATLTAITIYSCYDDKGNYDYHEISEIMVDSIRESYEVIAYRDTLIIKPEITTTNPADEFEYLWTVYSSERKNKEGKIIVDTIGQEPMLTFPVDLRPADYKLTFTLKNKDGREQYETAFLYVRTDLLRGFYLFKDINGNAELDLHRPGDAVMSDLLEKSGMTYQHPYFLGICPAYSFINAETGQYDWATTLNVMTENHCHILSTDDLSEVASYDNLFFGEKPNGNPLFLCPGAYGAYFFTEDGAYATTYSTYNLTSGKFGDKLVFTEYPQGITKTYQISPHISSLSNIYQVYFFDDLSNQILYVDYLGESITNFMDGNSMVKIPHTLKYLGGSGFRLLALFEDEQNAEKYYLYFLKVSMMGMSDAILSIHEFEHNSPLVGASMYACNETDGNVLYCVKDGKFYVYYVEDERTEEFTPQEFDTSAEITWLGHCYWTASNDSQNNFNYLAIATYKEGYYKVYFYEKMSAQPYGKPKLILEGKGRVKGVQYASPEMSQSTNSNLSLIYNLF